MSIFYSHRDWFCNPTGEGRPPAASFTWMAASRLRTMAWRAIRRAGAALGIIHRGIVTAKTRRLQRELRFHGGARPQPQLPERCGLGGDAAQFARAPLLLGDKWDF